MDHRRAVKLSKFLALILRHQPQRFGLELDREGWVPIAEVMEVLRGLPNFRWVTRADVDQIAAEGSGDEKRRFEIADKRIRAVYGHSVAQPVSYEACPPPRLLYHGTSPENLASILETGLRPMNRQYVHLSTNPDDATRVGQRHGKDPIILTIRSAEAHAAGVEFFQADERVYLARLVPPEYILGEYESDPSAPPDQLSPEG